MTTNDWYAQPRLAAAREHADTVRRRAVERALAREQARAQSAEDSEIDRLLARDPIEGFRRHIALLATRHQIRITWDDVRPRAARWRRRVYIPRIRSATDYAVGLHEAGHILSAPCTERRPHRGDPTNTRAHACIACELDAWRVGIDLARIWEPAMHARLRTALESYRRTTPTFTDQIDALERLSGGVTLRRQQLRHAVGLEGRRYLVEQWRNS